MFCWLELETARELVIPINDSGSVYGGGNHWALLHINSQEGGKSVLYNSAEGSTGVNKQA